MLHYERIESLRHLDTEWEVFKKTSDLSIKNENDDHRPLTDQSLPPFRNSEKQDRHNLEYRQIISMAQ